MGIHAWSWPGKINSFPLYKNLTYMGDGVIISVVLVMADVVVVEVAVVLTVVL